MAEIKGYRFLGFEHLLILPESDKFIVSLLDPQGTELTCQADIWTLPAELPAMLSIIDIEKVVPLADDYDVVHFVTDKVSFDGQAKVVQAWYEWRERLRQVAMVGVSKIDDGEFEDDNSGTIKGLSLTT